jgi:polyisoprenoid-binding protein YceI
MNKPTVQYAIAASILTICGGAGASFARMSPLLVGNDSGTATFRSSTNVPGIEVTGTSNALTAKAEVQGTSGGLIVENVEATVPVKSLATGMKIRDEHMRKYIFATSGGEEPDLYFNAANASCPVAGVAQGFACQMLGNLSIRGVARPFAINLKVKEQAGALSFRVAGDGIVKLSDYGISPPTQFGVKPVDKVEIHLDFTSRQKLSGKVDGAGGQ